MASVLVITAMSSCTKKINEAQKSILEWDIPLEIYQHELNTLLTHYVGNVCSRSLDMYDEEEEEKRSEMAGTVYGQWLNSLESDLFSTFGYRTTRQQLTAFIDNAESVLEEIEVKTIPQYVKLFMESIKEKGWEDFNKNHPILNARSNAKVDERGYYSTGKVAGIDYLPAEIRASEYDSIMKLMNDVNVVAYPSIQIINDLFGVYDKPKNYNGTYMLTAFNRIAETIAARIPKPVYAVFNKEQGCWEVGYNNEEAYLLRFQEQNGIMMYQVVGAGEYNINNLKYTL